MPHTLDTLGGYRQGVYVQKTAALLHVVDAPRPTSSLSTSGDSPRSSRLPLHRRRPSVIVCIRTLHLLTSRPPKGYVVQGRTPRCSQSTGNLRPWTRPPRCYLTKGGAPLPGNRGCGEHGVNTTVRVPNPSTLPPTQSHGRPHGNTSRGRGGKSKCPHDHDSCPGVYLIAMFAHSAHSRPLSVRFCS